MKMLTLGASLVLATTLGLAPVATPAQAQLAAPENAYQQQIFGATNKQRAQRDRVALRHQRCVQGFAVRQALRMAREERLYHQDLGRVLRRCGLSTAGENVAYGFPNGRSVVRGWMRSDGHRRNILNRSFRLLGSGAAQSNDGTWYAAQVFGR